MDRYEGCLGIKLFKYRNRIAQLWFCPANYTIKKHSHPNEHIELWFIFGRAMFHRINRDTGKQESGSVIGWFPAKFKTFTVGFDVVHWFNTNNHRLIFVNFSKFKTGVKSQSASVDFKEFYE